MESDRQSSSPTRTKTGVPAGYLHRWGPDEEILARQIARAGFGSVLSARHFGPYPTSDRRADTHSGDELLAATTDAGGRIGAVDPATCLLAELIPGRGSARIQCMPIVKLNDNRLPVTPHVFYGPNGPDEIRRLTAVSLVPQGSKPAAASAPYFRVDSARSRWRWVNQALLEETARQVAGGRPLAAWLEVTEAAMADGLIDKLANDYIAADYVFIRVAAFSGGYASRHAVRQLLAGITRLREIGVRPVLDCVGPVGVASLTIGAHAYTSGYPFYRHVPEKMVQTGGPPISGPRLRWVCDDSLIEMPPADAAAALAAGELDRSACRCSPLDPDGLRRHAIHVNRSLAAVALNRPVDETLERLHQSGSRPARTWASAAADVMGITLPSTQSAR